MAVAVASRTIPAAPARAAARTRGALRAVLFAAVAAAYALLGVRLALGLGVLAPDAVERLARAYLAWHGSPAKLAVLGFGAPPAPAAALLPFGLLGAPATSLVALPVLGGACGAVTVLALERTLAEGGMGAARRAALVAAFALNPIVAFHFTAGTPTALALALLAVALRALLGWAASADPRALLAAGVAFAGAVLCRHELVVWALVAGAGVAVALTARGAGRDEAEGSSIAFGAPAVAALAVWTLLAAAIAGDPLRWVTDTWDAGPPAGLGAGDAVARGLELTGLGAPLVCLAAVALVAVAAERRDAVAGTLAALLAAGLGVAVLHAYAADAAAPLELGTGALLTLAALAGLAWAHRCATAQRTLLWAAALVVLVGGAAGAWRAMEHYRLAGPERAWAHALRTGDDQGATAAARQIGRAVRTAGGRVLADESASGAPILLSRRGSAFVTRAGAGEQRWRAALARPRGRVAYVLAARGDASDRARPGLLDGRDRGLLVVAAAGPYVLARVLP